MKVYNLLLFTQELFIDLILIFLFSFYYLQSLPQTPKSPGSMGIEGSSTSSSSSETVDDSGSEPDNSLVFQVYNWNELS